MKKIQVHILVIFGVYIDDDLFYLASQKGLLRFGANGVFALTVFLKAFVQARWSVLK